MQISVGIYPGDHPAEIIDSAKLAEQLRFSTLWVLDSHLLFHEVYTLLGALAVSTRKIRLGTAVTNPLTRHPTVTASAFLTLTELSGGRTTLGMSIGDSALKTMGLAPATMAGLAHTVALCRQLLGGQTVSFSEESGARLHAAAPMVPIYIAATGRKMLELAGQIADGVILMNGVAPELIQAAVRIVREGERAAPRREAVRIAVWAACHPSYEAVKFNVARAILRGIPGPIDELARSVAARVKQSYDYRQHGQVAADFARLIPDQLVPRYAFSGEPAVIGRQIGLLGPCGVDEVILAIPNAPDTKSRNMVMGELAALLLSR
jgi:5,10-methylenetetrahydromethanopterin reductase